LPEVIVARKRTRASPQADAFLADICAHPEDDAPRLVYADWLDDHGDADRAEFIRIQCRLAGMDEFDHARADLEWRAWQLLRGRGADWAKPASKYTKRIEFLRGFVGRMTLNADRFLAQADAILAGCPLRELRLLKAERGDNAQKLAACEHLGRLRALDLHSCKMGMARTVTLIANPDLAGVEELNLGNLRMRNKGAQAVLGATHLAGVRSLDLNHNQLDDGVIKALANSPLTHLRHLDLGHNELTAAGVEQLGRIPHLRRLESLALYDTPHGDEVIRRLVATNAWVNLRKLDLSDTNNSADGSRLLTECPHLAGLTGLRIRGMLWPGDLARTPYLRHLREIAFTIYPQGSDAGVRAWLDSPAFVNLRALQVTGLAEPYARVLFSSPACKGLVKLNLFSNYDGTRLARLIAESPHLGNLVELDMRQCRLDCAGVTYLANSPNLPKLARLQLGWNFIREEGFRALLRSPYLQRIQELSLYGHQLPSLPTMEQALRERFGPALVLTVSP
jgi:uncharacterized protein (TIGR02996 family)